MHKPLKSLVFCCSSQSTSVAVSNGSSCASKRVFELASSCLIASMHELLSPYELQMAELDFIGFVNGPGAFTSVRTACSVAKTLGWSLSLPVVPINMLDYMLACSDSQELQQRGGVCVLLDARMQQWYARTYQWQSGWLAQSEVVLMNYADAYLINEAKTLIMYAPSEENLYQEYPGISKMQFLENPKVLLELANQIYRLMGEGVDVHKLQPYYVRNKVALTELERS
ncbi:MAG: tRNA (adenosine(37)-N6)-threonylcarbamoyltransferase complex dimerization subunit type 1 TsaB [Gammaproteobacteria bacterium]|nr:tRNA (adenosine(37)-N6)-threonylcarbamoyltransferase complex dimerization subunit type 1 TsaB [Gammaproteobacteria bacterium]